MTTRSPPKRKADSEGNTKRPEIVLCRQLQLNLQLKAMPRTVAYLLTQMMTPEKDTCKEIQNASPLPTQIMPPDSNTCKEKLTTDYTLPNPTYPIPILITLTSPYLIPDMDTSSGPAKRNLRASITRKYEERVAETTARIDPNRAKARTLLKDVSEGCLLYTSPSPRDRQKTRMPSSA